MAGGRERTLLCSVRTGAADGGSHYPGAPDGKTLRPGAPVPLVPNRIVFDAYRGVRNSRYAVTPDGQRFLMIVPAEEAVTPVVVILNWAGRGVN